MQTGLDTILMDAFPHARRGFIDEVIKLLSLHDKKNNDYNGQDKKDIVSEFETHAKFADVRRKFSRLYHAIAEKNELQVNESLLETAQDLSVYAILFTEYLNHANETQG